MHVLHQLSNAACQAHSVSDFDAMKKIEKHGSDTDTYTGCPVCHAGFSIDSYGLTKILTRSFHLPSFTTLPFKQHRHPGNFRPEHIQVFPPHSKFKAMYNSSGFIQNLQICFGSPVLYNSIQPSSSYQHGMTLDEFLSPWVSRLHLSSFMRQGKVVHLAPCRSFHLHRGVLTVGAGRKRGSFPTKRTSR